MLTRPIPYILMLKIMKKTLFPNRAGHYVLVMIKYSTLVFAAVCCLCSFSLAKSTYGQKMLDQLVTIDLREVLLSTALEKIAYTTDVKLAYDDYSLCRSGHD